MKRSAAYNIRGAIHEAERTIPSSDRSQLAEWERDLAANACVSLWDIDIKGLLSCLRRLTNSPERKETWKKVLELAQGTFQRS